MIFFEAKVDSVTNKRALVKTIEESYVLQNFLRTVPSKLHIASTIEHFGDLEKMSVEETIGSLKVHEERIRGQSESSGGKLLLTEEEWLRRENSEQQLLLTREEWLKRSSKGGTYGSVNQKARSSPGGDYRERKVIAEYGTEAKSSASIAGHMVILQLNVVSHDEKKSND